MGLYVIHGLFVGPFLDRFIPIDRLPRGQVMGVMLLIAYYIPAIGITSSGLAYASYHLFREAVSGFEAFLVIRRVQAIR